jgi:iron complex outermembrane receptor protein
MSRRSKNSSSGAALAATIALYIVPHLAAADEQLEEVVVTAEKRSERLQDVPVPVTSLSGDNLVDNNQLRLQDYFASVPGLNLTTDDRGTPNLAIRGVSTGAGAGNPTVSITVDDVPYGSSSTYGGGYAPVPDIDPSDLARVEVLRGPQGTLYGASSIGGLLSYVTNGTG